MKVYLDTSVLGAYYTPESKSDVVAEALQAENTANAWLISHLVETEFISLLARKRREGLLTKNNVEAAIDAFNEDKSLRFTVLAVPLITHQAAQEILLNSQTSARSLDALHLASALLTDKEDGEMELWTADSRMANVANAVGIRFRLF